MTSSGLASALVYLLAVCGLALLILRALDLDSWIPRRSASRSGRGRDGEEDRERGLADEQRKRLQEREEKLQERMQDQIRRESRLYQERSRLVEEGREIEARARRLEQREEQCERRLEELASMDLEQARAELLSRAESQAGDEAAALAARIVERAEEEAHARASQILAIALQRYAGSQTSVSTAASVLIKGQEMKGRVIGREGRNIRCFENATGMTVLIDDSSDELTISGFDPVRREIARVSMERLIADGRIHPVRIEKVVEMAASEMDERTVKLGEDALRRLGLGPVDPQVARRLGRLHFRRSYSQNLLEHSVEVAQIARLIAVEMRLDGSLAARAGLLHDIGKALGGEHHGSHAVAGAAFLRQHGESEEVAQAVASHHEEVQPQSVLGRLVAAADAVSASRPGARSEPVEAYINRLEALEEIGRSFPGVEKCYALNAGREVRVFVRPEEITDRKAEELAGKVCRRIEERSQYPGRIQVTVVREMRCIDYAT